MKCEPTQTPDGHRYSCAEGEVPPGAREAPAYRWPETVFQADTGICRDYAADPHKPVKPRDPISEDIDVAILGAGWGGIMAAYHLKQAGVTNFRNVDPAGDFGGVWYWNRYPGIQCDNESYCYLPLLEEIGFMPSKKFADGWEIHEYAKSIAEKFGFADRALFHTQINSLRWDEKTQALAGRHQSRR